MREKAGHPPAFSQASDRTRKFFKISFAKAHSAVMIRAAWEDAGVVERDGFEIRCVSNGT
ncbi:hypothetical protein PSEUDO8O_30727 [Pseudomonas sp. 8O]|nr:hypothetical protein PSEUDO8O_30727 [Pseudomonas sp. 8O]